MRASSDKKLYALVETLYETAAEGSSGAWRSLLKEMAHIFSSGPAAITLYSPETDHFSLAATTYSDGAARVYNERFRHISPAHPTIIKMRPGQQFWRLRDRPDSEFLKSETFREFFKREGVYDLLYYVLFIRCGISVGVTFSRGSAKTAFKSDDLNAIEGVSGRK